MMFLQNVTASVRIGLLAGTLSIGPPTTNVSAQMAEFLGPHVTETMRLNGEIPGTGRIGGIAFDSYGYLYVANQDEGVWKIHPDGRVEHFVKGLFGSGGNAVLPNGELLQASFGQNRIIRVARDGMVHPFASEGLDGPVGIAVTREGDVYTANFRGGSISKITPDGVVSQFAKDDRLEGPNGVTTDAEGNLYVVNLRNTIVLKITPAGEMTEVATLPGVANAHIAYAGGALYVTQIWSHVVLRVALDGTYAVVAGDGTRHTVDGPAGASALPYPNGIAASPSGDALYVNTLRGNMIAGHMGVIDVQKIYLPTPQRSFLQAYDAGGIEGLRAKFEEGRALREVTMGQLAPAVYQLARAFLQRQEVEAGLALAGWMVDLDPDEARAHRSIADMHAIYGERDVAIEHYEQALALQPDDEMLKRRLEAAQLYRRP